MLEYEEEIGIYAKTLQDFISKYELPDTWFSRPDHLAIKCADALEYEYKLQELMIDAQSGSQIEMDQRRLATLHLISSVQVGELGSISWLELMEPRPEKVGKDVVGLEHMEFYYPYFDEITETLHRYKIPFTEESNPGHSWINIVLNEQGQELKLNNKLLADTVEEELEAGTARPLIA